MSFLGLFSRKRRRVSRADFPVMVEKLARELEALREQFVFGGVSGLKSEGADVSGIPSVLEYGTELDSALQGFQLTAVVGFAWKYMDVGDRLPFDCALTQCMTAGNDERTNYYRERYLDCQGDVEALSVYLAEDVLRLWGLPERAVGFFGALRSGSVPLMILSQVAAAAACGDEKTGRKLKRRLRLA